MTDPTQTDIDDVPIDDLPADEPIELDDELADHVDASLDRLARTIELDSSRTMQTPMGPMSEAELVDAIRPMLWQYVGAHPDQALDMIAVIYGASRDLLIEHGDDEPDDLAETAIERL